MVIKESLNVANMPTNIGEVPGLRNSFPFVLLCLEQKNSFGEEKVPLLLSLALHVSSSLDTM